MNKLKIMLVIVCLLGVILPLRHLHSTSNFSGESVLILFSKSQNQKINRALFESLRQELNSKNINLIPEHLNIPPALNQNEKSRILAILKEKINSPFYKKFNAIVAVDRIAMELCEDYSQTIFEGIPIIYLDFGDLYQETDDKMERKYPGYRIKFPFEKQLTLIKNIQTETDKLYIVTSGTNRGKLSKNKFSDFIDETSLWDKDKVVYVDLSMMSFNDISHFSGKTSSKDAFLVINSYLDNHGQVSNIDAITEMIVKDAQCPVYHIMEDSKAAGIVGGYTIDFKKLSLDLSRKLVMIIGGTRFSHKRFSLDNPYKLKLNYQAAKIYKLDFNNIDDEIIYVNKRTPIDRIKEYAIWINSIVLIFIIVFIVIFIKNSKKVIKLEKDLVYYKTHYGFLYNSLGEFAVLIDRDTGNVIEFNDVLVNSDFMPRDIINSESGVSAIELFGENFFKSIEKNLNAADPGYLLFKLDFLEYKPQVISKTVCFTFHKKNYCYVLFNFYDKINQTGFDNKQKLTELITQEKMLKSLFYNLTREIRNPINVISGLNKLILDKGFDLEDKSEYAEAIQKSSKNVIDIMEKVLIFSNIEFGSNQRKMTTFSINKTLRYVLEKNKDFLQEYKPNLKIELLTSISDGYDEIYNDRDKFVFVLNELIYNACKFTEHGKIEFGYTSPNNNEVIFYVRDSGCGITDEFKDSIFEKYKVTDNYISNHQGEGVGLGLAICKSYIAEMGGNIWLSSELGNGTTFFFFLDFKDNNFAENNTNNQDKPKEIL